MSSAEESPRYRRVLLKISGEMLGSKEEVFNKESVNRIADEIISIKNLGVEVGIVVGGGNILRGPRVSDSLGIDRVVADYMGMLATVMNGLALQSVLEQKGVTTRLMSATPVSQLAEPFIRRRALRHLEKGRVVIFSFGTGNPYFSTDTAAALRAIEIKADIILKGTKVDGIYNGDPAKIDKKDLILYKTLTYMDALKDELGVMDATAISLCKENRLPIIVFNLYKKGILARIVKGGDEGTIVS